MSPVITCCVSKPAAKHNDARDVGFVSFRTIRSWEVSLHAGDGQKSNFHYIFNVSYLAFSCGKLRQCFSITLCIESSNNHNESLKSPVQN